MTAIILILIFIFGAVIGSFLNVLILRLPQDKSVGGRSHCMNCNHELSAKELVPVFSYIFLRGKCSRCGHRISPRYWIIEIATGLLFLFTFIFFQSPFAAGGGLDWLALARALFAVSVMVVVFMIDLEHYLILDKIIFPSIVIILLLNLILDWNSRGFINGSYFFPGLIAAAGLFAFFGLLYMFSAGRWIGFGDVKLAVLLGLTLPFPFILVGVFLAFFIGSIAGVILIATGNKTLGSKVPFGTFLAASTVISLWFGQGLLDWYLRIIGLR